MILVATIGRSGSSMLMDFFANCGIKIGTDVWFDKFNAGLEHKDICSINTDLINVLVKEKDINLWHVYGRIHDLKLKIYKDPQLLVHEDIIRHWWKVRKDIKVIFLHRNPNEIVESMRRLPEWSTNVYRCFPEMIEAKNKAFLATLDELKIPYKTFKFPDFLTTPVSVIEELEQWVDLPKDSLDIWIDTVI